METNMVFSPSIHEKRWVSQGQRTLVSEYTIDMDSIPTIFKVPKSTNETKPEAYTPQLLGLGPYHHLRPELYSADKQKLAGVKNFLKQNSHSRDFFGKSKMDLEPVVRANYDKYLDLKGSTLEYIIAIDSIYLLDFLAWYDVKTEAENLELGHLELAKDVIMLENQIPAFALEKMGKALNLFLPVTGTNEEEEDLFSPEAMLYSQLFYNFCKAHSPLKLAGEIRCSESHHLLAQMYHMIVNNQTEKVYIRLELGGGSTRKWYSEIVVCLTILGELGLGGALINPLLFSFKSLKVLVNSNLAEIFTRNEERNPKKHFKIEIPSASEMSEKHHVQFHPIRFGGIRNIKLFTYQDVECWDIFLPTITLKRDSEVVLRNLLAYEAAVKSSFELAEYVDLMCGIVRAPKDVALLRKRRIVNGDLNDEQVAEMFNGIMRCVEKSKEESASQKAVKQVKELVEKWENKKWYRRQYRFLKKNVKMVIRKSFGIAMKYVMFMFMALLLMLQILLAYCQVYGCNMGDSKANALLVCT